MGWVSSLTALRLLGHRSFSAPSPVPPLPPFLGLKELAEEGYERRAGDAYWATGRGKPREVTKPWIKRGRAGGGGRAFVRQSRLRDPE